MLTHIIINITIVVKLIMTIFLITIEVIYYNTSDSGSYLIQGCTDHGINRDDKHKIAK